ncbi:hypothetical protein NMG60_11001822 [Bertholletia excelsa]
MCSIVVFSKTYASSSWCLNELFKIVECMKELRQTVYPVFYDVHPSEVSQQKGKFGEGFEELVSRHDADRAQRWRAALREAGTISGWDLQNPATRFETKVIEELVTEVFKRSNQRYLGVGDDLVGINPHMKKVIDMLELERQDVGVVGIGGLEGIGKTKIAKAVYDSICWQFDASCFLESVRKVLGAGKSGLRYLQELLLSELTKEKDLKVGNTHTGKALISTRFKHKKI